MLMISVFSSIVLLFPKVPLSFVRIHVRLVSLPPIVALLALIFNHESFIWGPWRLDTLSWLLALFVLTIGFIVQRYSTQYLQGDRSYRMYFTLLTLMTSADSAAWFSDDLRLLLVCWGTTLLGLTLLIGLKKEWIIAKKAAVNSSRQFTISWLLLLGAFIWVTQETGQWKLSLILNENSLSQIASWEKTCINLLLIVSIMILAAQWPFQRWLLDSVVAPTPISAVMHAGIVNAGGIILTRFAPLFSGDAAQIILLILCSVSVLIGTGIMLVQVDYKRQLVGSTIAQMGFMLIQCALGAYLAAIIHAVLHGLFKSTLFLQAGSAFRNHEQIYQTSLPTAILWRIIGGILGLLIGVGFWLTAPENGYQLISSLILGWSVLLAWTQMVASRKESIGRLSGIILFSCGAIVYNIVHSGFYHLLHATIQEGIQASASAVVLLLIILLSGSAVGVWLAHNRLSNFYAVVYLWLVRMGDPKIDLVESHPNYLTKSMSQGGNRSEYTIGQKFTFGK